MGYDAAPYDMVVTRPPIEAGMDPAVAIILVLVFLSFAIIAYAFGAIFLGKVFKKAGVSPVIAWIPVYNNWKMLEIGGQQGFWVLLYFIPFINIVPVVFTIMAVHNINKKLGFDTLMTLLAVFFSYIWIVVAGVTKNPWNDSLGSPRRDTPTMPPASPQGPGQPYPLQQPYPPVQPQEPKQPYPPQG